MIASASGEPTLVRTQRDGLDIGKWASEAEYSFTVVSIEQGPDIGRRISKNDVLTAVNLSRA